MYLFTYPRKKIQEAPLFRGTFFLNDITAVTVGTGSYIIYIVYTIYDICVCVYIYILYWFYPERLIFSGANSFGSKRLIWQVRSVRVRNWRGKRQGRREGKIKGATLACFVYSSFKNHGWWWLWSVNWRLKYIDECTCIVCENVWMSFYFMYFCSLFAISLGRLPNITFKLSYVSDCLYDVWLIQ